MNLKSEIKMQNVKWNTEFLHLRCLASIKEFKEEKTHTHTQNNTTSAGNAIFLISFCFVLF